MDEILEQNSTAGKHGFHTAAMAVVAVLLLAVMVFAGCASQSQNQQDNGSQSQYNSNNASISITKANDTILTENKTSYDKNQTIINGILADGTYSQSVSYMTPQSEDIVDMAVTVKNDVVTDAAVSPVDCSMMSIRYIDNFNSALPDMVIGKKINEISLPRNVAGSSLTTAAFQQYVDNLVTSKGAQS